MCNICICVQMKINKQIINLLKRGLHFLYTFEGCNKYIFYFWHFIFNKFIKINVF